MDTRDFSDDVTPNLVDEGVLTAADLEAEADGDLPPQLYEADDPMGLDTEAAMVAEEGEDEALEIRGVIPAEEAAVRVEEDPGGLNYDPDPGYLR